MGIDQPSVGIVEERGGKCCGTAEAGIGALIEQLARLKHLDAETFPDELDGRPCMRIAIALHDAERLRVWFDVQTRLPVQFEAWNAAGDLVERYHYRELAINPGVADAAFAK